MRKQAQWRWRAWRKWRNLKPIQAAPQLPLAHACSSHDSYWSCTVHIFIKVSKLTQFLCFFFNSGHFHLSRAYFRLKWNILKTKYQNQVGLFLTFLTNVHCAAPLPLSYMVYWLPRELYNDLFKTPCNCISLRSTVKLGEILLWIERAFLFSFIYSECTIAISIAWML